MKAQDFRALVEQLGDLSQVQRDALVEALSAKGAGEEVVAMIETRFAAAPACGHCGEVDFKPWGSASDLKRYMCKACGRTFNALTGTPLAGLRLREKWLDYARSLVDGVSLRKAAARTGIRLDTSFRWRHRFLATARDKKASAVTGIVEADETFILKSAKGSRKLVGRAPRKRGGKAKKPGLSTDEHDAILIVRDRHGETTDAILFDLSGETIGSHLKPVVAIGRRARDRRQQGLRGIRGCDRHRPDCARRQRRRTDDRLLSHPERQRLPEPLQGMRWLNFKGVASKYLPSYLGWRRMIERDGDALTPRQLPAPVAMGQRVLLH